MTAHALFIGNNLYSDRRMPALNAHRVVRARLPPTRMKAASARPEPTIVEDLQWEGHLQGWPDRLATLRIRGLVNVKTLTEGGRPIARSQSVAVVVPDVNWDFG